MNIYQQLRVVRAALKSEGKFCEIFPIFGPDLEGIDREWMVEVRGSDTDELLKAIRAGIRRIVAVK